MINKLCLVRLSALGDVILITPLVRLIQQAYPACEITWITSPEAHDLLAGLSNINFKIIQKPKSLKDYGQFYQSMRDQHFDVLIAAQASWRANFLYPLISADRKIGFSKPHSRDMQHYFVHERIPSRPNHLAERFLQFAEQLNIPDPKITWDLPISAAATQWAQTHCPSVPFFVVNPMASKFERSCSVDFYRRLIQAIRKRWQYPVVITGGPSLLERSFAMDIAADLNDAGVINLVGQTSPKQLAAVLKQAKTLIAPDTGPVHIATAVGTPVIGLYAVVTPELSGPYGQLEQVIDQYPQAVERFLAKSKNTIPWGTRVHYREAMNLISLESVLEKLWDIAPC